MRLRTSTRSRRSAGRRPGPRRPAALASALALVAVMVASSGPTAMAAPATLSPNPSPAASGHPYRHGVVPPIGTPALGTPSRPAAASPAGTGQLSYGGGISNIGVTTGPPKVYVVFWGAQWSTASLNSQGHTTLAGDPSGMAPALQGFFQGLGTGSETWSGVMTQYCEGVATGTTTCPANSAHVGYPSGGALAGVWEDTSAPSPASASAHQLGVEAVAAASHFGNSSQASNRNAEYFIVSPHGTTPDGFNTPNGTFCAWHDFSGDSTLNGGGAVSGPSVAFTNMPYVTDMGGRCGANKVNAGSGGSIDGVTIVGGHEYAETITDQFPAGGWTDTAGSENGDKCAWIASGQGALQNLSLTTGTFAVQSTWANDTADCRVSHAIVGAAGDDFSIAAAPNNLSVAAGTSGSTTISTGVISGSAQSISLSAGGLPSGAGASFSPAIVTTGGTSTLTITASASASATTSTVTVTGTGGSTSHTTAVSLTVTAPVRPTPVANGGFETGNLTGWTATGASETVVSPGHTGNFAAQLAGPSPTNGDSTIQQTITVGTNATLSFAFQPHCPDTLTYDQQQVQVRSTSGAVLATVLNVCDNSGVWKTASASLAGFAGQTVVLWFNSHDDNYPGDPTYILFDDIAVSGVPLGYDFSMSASDGVNVVQGQGGNSTISTAVVSGSAQPVALSATGLPAGANASFTPSNPTAGSSSVMAITTTATTTPGTYPITVTGTEGSVTHTTTVSLTVTARPNDFSISSSGGVSVVQGGSGNTTISTAFVAGAAQQTVALTASSQPTGATISFNPTSVTVGSSSTMTIATAATTAAGSYTITVTGAEGALTHTTTVSLTVTPLGTGPIVTNGGFESGFAGWTTSGASVSLVAGHTGTNAARLGTTTPTNGDSTMQQIVALPANATTLTFWYQPNCPDTLTYDQQQVQVRSTTGAVLATVLNVCDNSGTWKSATASVAGLANRTVVLWFNSHDDNYPGDPTYIAFDDIAINHS